MLHESIFARLLLIGLLMPLALVCYADQSRDIRTNYPVTSLSERIHVIYGPRGAPSKENQAFINNVSFVITNKGVVVIDTGSSF